MSRVIDVKEILYKDIENKCYGKQKLDGFDHLSGVSSLCAYLANQRYLDEELASIIGLLHDCSTYLTGTSFDHAARSSDIARKILNDLDLFNRVEINIICNAIRNHSDKDKLHDEYSELIKDADVLQQYFNEIDAVLPLEYQKRINKLINK